MATEIEAGVVGKRRFAMKGDMAVPRWDGPEIEQLVAEFFQGGEEISAIDNAEGMERDAAILKSDVGFAVIDREFVEYHVRGRAAQSSEPIREHGGIDVLERTIGQEDAGAIRGLKIGSEVQVAGISLFREFLPGGDDSRNFADRPVEVVRIGQIFRVGIKVSAAMAAEVEYPNAGV